MIGAIYGLIMILVEYYFLPITYDFIRYLIISLLIIPVIYTTIIFNKKNASYFSCVVFLSIVVMHIDDNNPYIFVLNRVLDTLIGIILALIVNTARIPRKKKNDILFVAGLDSSESTLTSYSTFELNTMLEDGAKFTIATMRPPAALLSALKDIKIKLPVIAMDGAMLYDIKNNRCLKVYEMTYDEVKEFTNIFEKRNFHYFTNMIMEDSVVIYYGEFKNPVEKSIYDSLRSSPYRNYVKGKLSQNYKAVYLMLIDKDERIEELYRELHELGYTNSHKILKYKSDDYPGYTYIKIYNKLAVKRNMIEYVQYISRTKKVITIGKIDGSKGTVINGAHSNEMVKKFKRVYEPYFWEE